MEKVIRGSKGLPEQLNELIDRCLMNPLSERPDTTGWGADETGYAWLYVGGDQAIPEFWDGTQIQQLQIGPYAQRAAVFAQVASGEEITHTLGRVPDHVQLTVYALQPYVAVCGGKTATKIKVVHNAAHKIYVFCEVW